MNDRTWRRIQSEVEPALSVASDGSAAVERARALKRNVVLMDLAMSGTDGLEISPALELDGAAGPALDAISRALRTHA
jgi:CheY-like chemotaxis protein